MIQGLKLMLNPPSSGLDCSALEVTIPFSFWNRMKNPARYIWRPLLEFQSDIHDGWDASAGRDVVLHAGRNRVVPPSVALSHLYHVPCSVSCFLLVSCSLMFTF